MSEKYIDFFWRTIALTRVSDPSNYKKNLALLHSFDNMSSGILSSEELLINFPLYHLNLIRLSNEQESKKSGTVGFL